MKTCIKFLGYRLSLWERRLAAPLFAVASLFAQTFSIVSVSAIFIVPIIYNKVGGVKHLLT